MTITLQHFISFISLLRPKPQTHMAWKLLKDTGNELINRPNILLQVYILSICLIKTGLKVTIATAVSTSSLK